MKKCLKYGIFTSLIVLKEIQSLFERVTKILKYEEILKDCKNWFYSIQALYSDKLDIDIDVDNSDLSGLSDSKLYHQDY